MDDHTNANIPTGVKITRRGDKLTLKFRTATIDLQLAGAETLALALLEITQSPRP